MKLNINKTTIQKLLDRAKKDEIQKIVVRAVIRRDDKFLLFREKKQGNSISLLK